MQARQEATHASRRLKTRKETDELFIGTNKYQTVTIQILAMIQRTKAERKYKIIPKKAKQAKSNMTYKENLQRYMNKQLQMPH